MDDLKKKYRIPGIHLPKPLTESVLADCYSQGMMRKCDLKDGCYYRGTCRNASVAVWVECLNVFLYRRYKFGSYLTEDIYHPEDDNGYDLFMPFYKVDPEENEVVDVDSYVKWKKDLEMHRSLFDKGES